MCTLYPGPSRPVWYARFSLLGTLWEKGTQSQRPASNAESMPGIALVLVDLIGNAAGAALRIASRR